MTERFNAHVTPSATEKGVAQRIKRYSALRSAERAIRPSVRRRRPLDQAGERQAVLVRLQRLLDGVRARGGQIVEPGTKESELASVDAELDHLCTQLAGMIRATPLAQFRATLPGVIAEHRADAVALLDLWLENLDAQSEPMYLVDYLITLLSTETVDGQITLVRDPIRVSPGVQAASRILADSHSSPPDIKLAHESAAKLRESSVVVLMADDLEEMIVSMRGLKADASRCFFDEDLLRSVVQYNVTVANRFKALQEIERQQDAAVERTLAALRALDETPSVSSD